MAEVLRWDWGNEDGSIGRGHDLGAPGLADLTAISEYIYQDERPLNGAVTRSNDVTADHAERVSAALAALVVQLRAIEAAQWAA